MDEKDFPRFCVIEEWTGPNFTMLVQLGKIAFGPGHLRAGGEPSIRVRLTDPGSNADIGFVSSVNGMAELQSLLEKALARHEEQRRETCD